LSGRFASSVRFHATGGPSFTEPLHQPGAGITADTDKDSYSNRPPFTAPRGARTEHCANQFAFDARPLRVA
jgi:hypothetical protein